MRDRGFAILEVLVAVVIMGIVAVPLSNMLITTIRTTDAAERRLERVGLAQVAAGVASRAPVADECDEGNNFDERRTITHARNACFGIAEKLGIKYFMQLDDDYDKFIFRINHHKVYPQKRYKIRRNLDKTFALLLEFYKSIPAASIAISQGGDWIGGEESDMATYKAKRKSMNSFICSTERPFKFVGAMNEDVNTYTTLGSRGELFFTIPFVSLDQAPTQSQAGGITDMYLRYGTYCKAFTTVMMMPSAVRVSMMQTKNRRLHHAISWGNTVPLIIDERFKKLVDDPPPPPRVRVEVEIEEEVIEIIEEIKIEELLGTLTQGALF